MALASLPSIRRALLVVAPFDERPTDDGMKEPRGIRIAIDMLAAVNLTRQADELGRIIDRDRLMREILQPRAE